MHKQIHLVSVELVNVHLSQLNLIQSTAPTLVFSSKSKSLTGLFSTAVHYTLCRAKNLKRV